MNNKPNLWIVSLVTHNEQVGVFWEAEKKFTDEKSANNFANSCIPQSFDISLEDERDYEIVIQAFARKDTQIIQSRLNF